MPAAVKAALRCQCVSLTSPAGTPSPGPPVFCVCVYVCMCVMMINTFVLKANRELLCVCISVCVCLALCVTDHVLASVWLCKCVFGCLCASVVSTPGTLLAVTSMIVVYSFGILHLVPDVHQPLSVLVRSFWFNLVSQITFAVNMFWNVLKSREAVASPLPNINYNNTMNLF